MILFILFLSTANLVGQWTQIPGLEDLPITVLFKHDGILYAGGHRNTILRSTDNGATWGNIAGIIQAETTLAFTHDGTYLFVGTSRGTHRSINRGDQWERLSAMPIGAIYVEHFLVLGRAILAGSYGGVYRSTDSGQSWTESSNGMGSPPLYIRRLIFDGNRVFALRDLQAGAYVSTDSGRTWSPVGLTGVWINDVATIDTNVFVGTNQGVFLYRSGTNWIARNNGLPASPYVWSLRTVDSVLFAGLSSGVYRSTDLGETWSSTDDGGTLNRAVVAIEATDSELIAGTFGGLWRRSLSGLISSVSEESPRPIEFGLSQNYPNPFNPTTKFEMRIADFGIVSLKVYNVLGQEVATLVNEQKAPGVYSVSWNASNLSSGVYYYRMTIGSFVETKKMMLVR